MNDIASRVRAAQIAAGEQAVIDNLAGMGLVVERPPVAKSGNELAADVLASLRTKWVVRQQVRTAQKRWLVDLFEVDSERLARQDYARLVAENPDSYFELVAVLHAEVCRDFTPHKGA